ncbi:MaoC family dehydratase N-terminal domain-containing protein [Roseomonas sp. GC11]|uniref:FAS1-like dehydratase domain-containing protein n=1 Tax=Roseomonas sp. GC11 TaxID=2950546 RepID=UPI00210EF40C|nr:MaoC family dehydratase N-terminal domain-containing protein [Roseomonas sp. GC11]MCQ4158488.1 MaoC family dehydratase N-terminal domain-containing protein [Roseomonas sp. GC11]
MAYEEYLGRTESREDRMDPRLAEGMAATLGQPLPPPGEDLPPLWHWMLFQDWRPAGGLGPDGHPQRGGFLPPVHHLERRMWAGGRLTFQGGLRVGDTLRRTSTILRIDQKAGGSGELVFVTVRHALEGPRGPVLEEEHDIVYRGTGGAALREAPAAPDWLEARRATVLPDAVALFRYSALTGNGHRIHYDHPYVTGVEGYPGLVVHGPLQATWLAAHALALAREERGPGARLARFAFRGLRAAIAGRPLTLLGQWEKKGEKKGGTGARLRLETRDDTGATCQAAEADLA